VEDAVESTARVCNALHMWEWDVGVSDIQEGVEGDHAPVCVGGRGCAPGNFGAIADMSDLSRAFIVPMVCLRFMDLCGRDSFGSKGLHGVSDSGGH
jgi:hypothetical protein